jgi:hypothetical protein
VVLIQINKQHYARHVSSIVQFMVNDLVCKGEDKDHIVATGNIFKPVPKLKY